MVELGCIIRGGQIGLLQVPQHGRAPPPDPVGSPAFADRDRALHGVIQLIEDAPDLWVGQSAAVVEMFVNPVRKNHLVLGTDLQSVEELGNIRVAPGGAGARELVLDGVVAGAFAEGPLGIPVDEAEQAVRLVAGGAPVVVRPIVVGGVNQRQEVVGHRRHVQLLLDHLETFRVVHVVSVDVVEHLAPAGDSAGLDLVELRDQIIVFIRLVPVGEELRVDALTRVVVALVLAVDEQVHKVTAGTHLADVRAEPPCPLVLDERVGVIVHAGPQHNAVERLHRGVAEQRVLQPSRPVVAAEVQPERVFAERQTGVGIVARTHVAAALDADAAVDGKAPVVVGTDQLG